MAAWTCSTFTNSFLLKMSAGARRCLTDGRNFLWITIDDFGCVHCFMRHAGSLATEMIASISLALNVRIVCEHEPEFWGFKTQKEWDEAWDKIGEGREQSLHIELLKYVRGEENNLSAYSVEEGEIAKKLVRENPSLLLPENQEELLKEAKDIFTKRFEARTFRRLKRLGLE